MTKRPFRVLMALAYNDPQYHRGIVEYANEAEWELDMTVAYYGTEPVHWKGDGVITHYLATRPNLMDWVQKQSVPVVSINADEVNNWPGTVPDHEKCGKLAAEYFDSLGLENYVFFRCSDIISIEGRQKAFFETARQNGGNIFLLDWRKHVSKKDSIAQLGQVIKKLPKPLGILSQSDHRAATLFNACEEAAVSIPQDVAILGVGNNATLCDFARVPLSSVDIDMSGVARQAAVLLDQLMQGKTISQRVQIIPPVGIVPRRSTKIMHISHPQVMEAVNFILDHFTRPINVSDVVRHVKMSRAGLNRLFEFHVGRSIASELLRVRINHAKQLLAAGDKKIGDVAMESGFSSYIHFAKAFRRMTKVSATEYQQSRLTQ